MPDREHAEMNPVQAARLHATLDRVVSQTHREQLTPSDETMLSDRRICDLHVR